MWTIQLHKARRSYNRAATVQSGLLFLHQLTEKSLHQPKFEPPDAAHLPKGVFNSRSIMKQSSNTDWKIRTNIEPDRQSSEIETKGPRSVLRRSHRMPPLCYSHLINLKQRFSNVGIDIQND